MRRLALSLREIKHVKHIGREAEAITELLHKDAAAHNPQTVGLNQTEINIDEVGQGNAPNHRPQPLLQSTASGDDTSDDATERESNQSQRTVGKTDLLRSEPQPSLIDRVDQEERVNLREKRFGQTV